MASKNPTDQELLQIADSAWDEAWSVANSQEGWKEVKRNELGDIVKMKKNKKGKKIYLVTAQIDVSPSALSAKIEDTEDMCKWNTTLTKHEILRRLNDSVAISYQVTAEGGPGGVVSARDFVFIYRTGRREDGSFVQAGCSVDIPGAPKDKKIVRAWNGPGCQIVRPSPSKPGQAEFVWLMDCEYRGWIPSNILELAMPVAQLQFVECVRKLAEKIKKEEGGGQ